MNEAILSFEPGTTDVRSFLIETNHTNFTSAVTAITSSIAALSWPTSAWTTLSGKPASLSSETAVWRKLWKLNSNPPRLPERLFPGSARR